MQNSELTEYMSETIRNILENVAKTALKNPREAAFLLQFTKYAKEAQERRAAKEQQGTHVPAFLMASITGSCNMHCKGCFARACGTCQDEPVPELSADEWEAVFTQAEEIGISFSMLIGGEPLMRRDVIETAAKHKRMIFPIFTNGVLATEYQGLFVKSRNLVPVFSIEGLQAQTDERRGKGTFERIFTQMKALKKAGVLFGVSVMVTTKNLEEVTSKDFLRGLADAGCCLIFYVEYEPVNGMGLDLAFTEETRPAYEEKVAVIRADFPNMVFLSFPGDEKHVGGCLAAGRGFFHLSPRGAAQPCPFSPYDDCNVREKTLLEILHSPLFLALQEENLAGGPHTGGCTLFTHSARVQELACHSSQE